MEENRTAQRKTLEARQLRTNNKLNPHKMASTGIKPGARFLKVPETFWAQKAISKTMKPFLYRASFISTVFAFKQSLHLCSILNLRIFLAFQLGTFEAGFLGLKTFQDFRETSPWSQMWEVSVNSLLHHSCSLRYETATQGCF